MANEGSTKPTYSELEAELRYIADSPTEDHGGFHPRVVKAAQDALAEILRVRGLLQRSREALLSCQESANTNPLTNGICIACGAAYDHYTNCVLLSSGAESADIGKLDRVDKKADV